MRVVRRVRYGLLWTFIAFGAGASLTWYFREAIFALLLAPADGSLSPYGLPVFTSPTEILSATIRLALTGGAVAALPVLTFSVFRVVSPFLTRRERRAVALFLPAVFLCYVSGAAFAYFVILPTALKFLLNFGEGVAIPMINIAAYMALTTALMFWLGVIFELPLAMFLLVKLKVVSHERFRKLRRYVPVAALFMSAIITPTFDVVNQTMVAVPIVVLYEVGLFLAGLARPKREGQRTMVQIIKAVVVGVLRRLMVVLLLVPALLIGVVYVTALSLVFVWDGHLSTETTSRGKAWMDGAYRRSRAVLARVAFLRKTPRGERRGKRSDGSHG